MKFGVRKLILPAAMVAAFSMPALAQIPVPHLEIHIAHTAPPRIRFERRPPRPAYGYVWINGAWDWQGDQWIWVPGRWDRPEGRARWIRPRYRHEYGAYRYEPGHWSTQRVIEGDDYHRWREERRHGRRYDHRDHRDRDHDGDHDHDHQR